MQQASLADKEWITELARARDYPATLGVSSERRREAILGDYERDWAALVAAPQLSIPVVPGRAFWILLHDQSDSLTGDSQAVIIDHAGPAELYPGLLEDARRRCREKALVVRVYPQIGPGSFANLGFQAELSRVAGYPKPQLEPEGFSLRRANPDDRFYLTHLNGLVTQAYIPTGREGKASTVAFRNVKAYLELDLSEDSETVGMILTHEGKDVGYFLLNLNMRAEISGEKAAYFYDIAVDPGFQKKGGARALMNHCQNWLIAHDFPMLIGDITISNKLAHHGAIGIVGCQIEYERWGLAL